MPSIRFSRLVPTLLITGLASACLSPKHIDETPITVLHNGQRVAEPTHALDAATTAAMESRLQGRARRDSIAVEAFADCAPAVCASLGRGELAIGMTEPQMLHATGTSSIAWDTRGRAGVAVFTPHDVDAMPRDAIAPVALVQLVNGRVSSITYREAQGLRTVQGAQDVANANVARAAALAREGDALALAGDFTAALDRYDRASVVTPADAELQYRMATSLDKLLRPIEAELRYKLFLHQLELEKIDAVGNANAKLASAIVQARERLVVLERR